MKLKQIIAIIVIAVMGAVSAQTGVHAIGTDDPAELLETVHYGHETEKSYISSLKNNLYYAEYAKGYTIPVLHKSRTLKKCFTMKSSETLVIPKGKTLTLRGGAYIAGEIYIEEGGTLLIEKYSFSLTGKILCDGQLSVTGGTLSCYDGSLIFIGENGSFTAADRGGDETELNGRIDAFLGASVICLGETNIPDPTFDSTPIAAVRQVSEFDGSRKKVEIVTDIEKLYPSVVGYDSRKGRVISQFDESYTILLSGGNVVTFSANPTIDYGWDGINGMFIRFPLAALKTYYENQQRESPPKE